MALTKVQQEYLDGIQQNIDKAHRNLSEAGYDHDPSGIDSARAMIKYYDDQLSDTLAYFKGHFAPGFRPPTVLPDAERLIF